MLSEEQNIKIKRALQKINPTFIGVFGSYARGEQNVNSDLDILIDYSHQVNLLDLIGVEQELTEVLGIKVDLITLKSVNADIRPYIESDLIAIK